MDPRDRVPPRRPRLLLVALCAGALAAVVLTTPPSAAASIPSWLDDAITKWNAAHPDASLRFVGIKDSFVWYDLTKTTEEGHLEIRKRVNAIVLAHGYAPLDDEERVTTGKPPVTNGSRSPKKCWSRSFVLNVEAQGDTKAVGGESPGQRQRMLTSLVCEDSATWWAAFRVAG